MTTALRIMGCLFALAFLGAEHGRDYGRHGTYIFNVHIVDGLAWAIFTGIGLFVAAGWCFVLAEMPEGERAGLAVLPALFLIAGMTMAMVASS